MYATRHWLTIGVLMNSSKQKLLSLFLFTGVLIGANPKQSSGIFDITDNNGDSVFLKWYKVDDLETFSPLKEKILLVMAEAFADQERDFLLDDKLQIRPEYVELFGQLPQDIKERLNTWIEIARCENRQERVRAHWQKYNQKWDDGFARDLVHSQPLVIIAENGKNKILGCMLVLRKRPEWEILLETELQKDVIWGQFLAIMPDAQGRGLTRPLSLSILKIMPEATRIIFGTTSWNTKAQKIYERLGCKRIANNKAGSLPSDCYYEYVIK